MIKKIISFILGSLLLCTPLFAASSWTCFDTDTKLMWHFNEADGITNITDSSATGHTETATGNVQTDSGITKFGNTSLFDGTGDYWSVPDNTVFSLSNANFTWDFWVRFASTAGAHVFFQQGDGTSEAAWFTYFASNTINFGKYDGAGNPTNIDSESWTPSTGTWYHVAFIRSGNSWYIFIDGTQIGTTTTDSTTFANLTGNLTVGAQIHSGSAANALNGSLEEFRFVAAAVGTSNFTAPTAEYSSTCTVARRRITTAY